MNLDIIIDEDDSFLLNKYNWHLSCGYARTDTRVDGKIKKILLHRIIMGVANEDWYNSMVDHVNGNKLDNRKCNLRICTHTENNRNVRIKLNNSSGLKGVSWIKRDNKWRARINIGGKEIHLGSFLEKKDAASAYNIAAKKLFGSFAVLNKI